MTAIDVPARAEELAETWVNGNLSDAIEAIAAEPPLIAAALAVRMSEDRRISSWDLLRLIENRYDNEQAWIARQHA